MHDKSRLLKSTRLESWKKADFNEERKRIETDMERFERGLTSHDALRGREIG